MMSAQEIPGRNRPNEGSVAKIVFSTEATALKRLAAREIRRYVFLHTGQLLALISPILAAQEVPGRNFANEAPAAKIVFSTGATALERLAAREIRRYVFLCTEQLLPLACFKRDEPDGEVIVIATAGSPLLSGLSLPEDVRQEIAALKPQEFLLRRMDGKRPVLLVAGGDDQGTLYGAYRLAEHYGARFYLHGDVIPDEAVPFHLLALAEKARPRFELRGLNPWGTHPFGFDLWDAEDYKALLGQMAKMRLNFIGIHCYPEGAPYAEPTVWIGPPEDFDPASGHVTHSYPSTYYNTAFKPFWGHIQPKKTSSYHCGGDVLFDRDDWSAEIQKDLCPMPQTPEECNILFNRTGELLAAAFGFAHRFGIKTCLGTETPLTIPKTVNKRLDDRGSNGEKAVRVREVYEGIFRRISSTHPLDYYWLWTPEKWTWHGNTAEDFANVTEDILLASEAAERAQVPFHIATAGWVLGPKNDRAALDKVLPKDISASAISRSMGHLPPDDAFGSFSGREKWAIPWLESDGYHGLTMPQPFVGRIFHDAEDAAAKGCNGLMGLHWRTEILSQNASALARSAWQETPLSVHDFYLDWCCSLFGIEAGREAAEIFAAIDGCVPYTVARGCPAGKLLPDERPWTEVAGDYAFVDKLQNLSEKVRGRGNRERFLYWLNTFRYARSLAEFRCLLATFNRTMDEIEKAENSFRRSSLAEEVGLPAYQALLKCYETSYGYLLATANTPGALATIVFFEADTDFATVVVARSAEKLCAARGRPLSSELLPSRRYTQEPRLIVPCVRSVCGASEEVPIKLIVLDNEPPRSAELWVRPLGQGEFSALRFPHVARGVYSAVLPASAEDVEYYVRVVTTDGETRFWPATAPEQNQTVIKW